MCNRKIPFLFLMFAFGLSLSAPARSQAHSSSKGTIAKLKRQIAAQAETIYLLEENKGLLQELISAHKETIAVQERQMDRMRFFADSIQSIEEREADLFDQSRKDGLLKAVPSTGLRQQNEGLMYTLREVIDLFLLRNSLSSSMKNPDHLGVFTLGEPQLGSARVKARSSSSESDASEEMYSMPTQGLKPRVKSRPSRSEEEVPSLPHPGYDYPGSIQSEIPESRADGARVRVVIPDEDTDVVYRSEVKDFTSKKKKVNKSVHPKKP
jgi:hypothetical protein